MTMSSAGRFTRSPSASLPLLIEILVEKQGAGDKRAGGDHVRAAAFAGGLVDQVLDRPGVRTLAVAQSGRTGDHETPGCRLRRSRCEGGECVCDRRAPEV
jgi:hypothetical protein